MAFDPENKNIKKALQKNETEQQTDTKDKLVIPVFKDEEERTKNYTFSLQPTARKRLDGLAKEHNFKSASKFLNELIKNMWCHFKGGDIMGIPISDTFLFTSLIVFWIIPVIGIAKKHLVDDRFFIRQWLFPMQYWLQLLFEKISGNRRIIVRILQ